MDERKKGPGDETASQGPNARQKRSRQREENSAPGSSAKKPLFRGNVESYIKLGLTLIPLHAWNAVDKKGRDRGKSPRDGAWQARDYDSEKQIEEATRTGINLGVRLPTSVVVLDVDPRNFPEGRDSLAELVSATKLDLKSCPHTLTGSGGHHYWFTKPADVQLLDSLDDYQGIEFKSLGRQVVAAGSVHPNGRRYEWDDLAPTLDEMPPMPEPLLRLCRRPTRAHGEASGYGELTREMLAESLEWLEPENFRDHDSEWLPLMMSSHHATAGEGRSEFIEWSTRDPQYQDDAWIIGRRWDSLHLHPTAGRKGRPVTIKFLHKVVQEAGGWVARPDPEDDFEAYEDEDELGQGVDDAVIRAEPKAEGLEAVLDEMNEKHCVVMEGGKFRIFTEEMDPVLKRPFFQRSTKEDFENLYCNHLVEKNDKLVSRPAFWIRHPKRRQYKGVIFDPSGEHEGWLNLWKGWAVKPEPGNWSLMQELIREVLTDGNEEHYEYVLNWCAFMFQHPEQVAEVAICFKGEKGTGKRTLGRALVDLAGTHGLHASSPEHLKGRFNSHLQNCVCLFADEAFWAGDKAGESTLKQLVTEPTLTIEGKGRDAVSGKNHVHLFIASNVEWVVPAGMDGERRFAIFEVNNKRKRDHAFFYALKQQMAGGGLAAMLHDLLARDMSDDSRHPRNIPQSDALAGQKLESMRTNALWSWWHHALQAGQLPYQIGGEDGRNHGWSEAPVVVAGRGAKQAVVEAVADHARRENIRADITKTKVARFLGGVGVEVSERDGRGDRAWIIPCLGDARRVFERELGGRVRWED